jgi:tetratricopeptide (TPR) repeat protein
LENRPKVEPLRINYAKALERLGRFAQADSVFRGVFEDFGSDQSTLEYVNYLLRRHQEHEAIQTIERSNAACSPIVRAQLLLAAAVVTARNGWGDGVRFLELAREAQPQNADVLNALEAAYTRVGNQAAIAQLRQAELAFEPQVPAQFVRRFNVLLSQQRYEEALSCAQRGLQTDANYAPLQYSAAIACANLGRKQEALDFVQSIEEKDGPVFVLAAYLRAAVAKELGQTSAAVNALQRLLAVEPNNPGAIALYASIVQSQERALT